MTREERNAEMGRLEGVSRELVANKKGIEAMPVLTDTGDPALRVLTLDGSWKTMSELDVREL